MISHWDMVANSVWLLHRMVVVDARLCYYYTCRSSPSGRREERIFDRWLSFLGWTAVTLVRNSVAPDQFPATPQLHFCVWCCSARNTQTGNTWFSGRKPSLQPQLTWPHPPATAPFFHLKWIETESFHVISVTVPMITEQLTTLYSFTCWYTVDVG